MTGFSQAEFPRLGGTQVHHIIPEASQSHYVILLLEQRASGLFRFNDVNNAIYLETRNLPGNTSSIHSGYDASHSGYNLAWEQILDSIQLRVGSQAIVEIVEGRSNLSLADQQDRINSAFDLVRETQDRARAGLQGLDGFERLVLNNNDPLLDKYASRNSTPNYDLSTTDGRRYAARDMALAALDIQTELSPDMHARIQMNRALFGDALPLAGLRTSRFYGDALEQSLLGSNRLSDAQQSAMNAVTERFRQVGIDPRIGFNSPDIYFQALVATAADQGAASPAGIELRAIRDRLRFSPEAGANIALNVVQFSLAAVEVYDLLRQGKIDEAAARIGEMTYDTAGSILGAGVAGAWAASIAARLSLGATPTGLAFILITTALGDQIGSTLFGQLYRGLYAAGLIDSSDLRSILQQALNDNVPGVSLAPDGSTILYQGQAVEEPDPLPKGEAPAEFPRCFLAGTPILMADGTRKAIEEIRVGDQVMAFDATDGNGRGTLRPSPVTRTFKNSARTILDLRGLRMTPGHVCLTDNGRFETITSILARDGLLFNAEGRAIRARTGAKAGSPEDAVVRIVFREPRSGIDQYVAVRAGIPFQRRRLPDGSVATLTLAHHISANGLTLLPDGSIRDRDGSIIDAIGWHHPRSPLEMEQISTFVVLGLSGRRHVPNWIHDLLQNENDAIIDETAKNAANNVQALEQLSESAMIAHIVGQVSASLPRIGACIGWRHHHMIGSTV